MDSPATYVEVNLETLEEVKEGGPLYHCDLFDTEIAHKIAQALLPGLASACVESTTGDLLKSPASVAVYVRKEMVEYLTQRSETFVAEFIVLEGDPDAEVSEHPYDIISDFIDDFESSKRNFFSRVSGWLLSERREDMIDDFVQEMETNGFWLIGRREAVAQAVLKNVDFKNTFHCNMKFNCAEELVLHIPECSFRTMNCTNEGCNARFSAAHMQNHDSVCPFKILPCEQKCSAIIMRREMDRHCITVCPMKLVNCPLYPVGCQASIPRCTVGQHYLESLHSHLLCILQVIHKEASIEDLKQRVEDLEKLSSPEQLAEARDVRSLRFAIKDLEEKLGPLEVNTKTKVNECGELPAKIEECTNSPTKQEECTELLGKKEESMQSPIKNKESKVSPPKLKIVQNHIWQKKTLQKHPSKGKSAQSQLTKMEEECTRSPSKSPTRREQCTESPTDKEESTEPQLKREACT